MQMWKGVFEKRIVQITRGNHEEFLYANATREFHANTELLYSLPCFKSYADCLYIPLLEHRQIREDTKCWRWIQTEIFIFTSPLCCARMRSLNG